MRWILGLLVVAAAVGVYVMRPAANPDAAPTTDDSAAGADAVQAAALPRLLDLGADKCIPCKMMAPILEELKVEYKERFTVEFVDVWKNEGAGKAYGIKMIPTQIFFKADGTEVFRHEGFLGKDDILATWRELGVEL